MKGYFFSERDVTQITQLGIKMDKNVEKVILFTKNLNKMVQKRVFFHGMSLKKGYTFSTWDH